MESEARLAMIDGGLPIPELQYEIVDGNGELRRLDFAWPNQRVAAEYDGWTGTAVPRRCGETVGGRARCATSTGWWCRSSSRTSGTGRGSS